MLSLPAAASALLRGPENTPGMSSIARRAANQRELKAKSPTAEKMKFFRFCKAAGRGNTGRIFCKAAGRGNIGRVFCKAAGCRNIGRISRMATRQNQIIHPFKAHCTLIILSKMRGERQPLIIYFYIKNAAFHAEDGV